MGKKERTFTPIKDIISNLLGDSDLPFNPDDARIWEVWNEVVGPNIAKNAQPSWIKDKRLRIKVSTPIWLQELEFEGEAIKENLNNKLKREAVDKIEFRLGTI